MRLPMDVDDRPTLSCPGPGRLQAALIPLKTRFTNSVGVRRRACNRAEMRVRSLESRGCSTLIAGHFQTSPNAMSLTTDDFRQRHARMLRSLCTSLQCVCSAA